MACSGLRSRLRALMASAVVLLLAMTIAPSSGRASPASLGSIVPAQEVGQESGHRVLLLYSEGRLTPSVVALDNALRSTIESRSPTPIHFQTEFLDLNTPYGVS